MQNLRKSLASDVEFICFSYKVGNLPLYPTNNIILELQPNVAISSVLQMFESEVSLEKSLKYDTYLLKVNQISRLLDIANQIYTSGLVKYAHPDFIAPIEQNNPLYPQQYYLNNTGQNGGTPNIDINAPEAWALIANAGTANARIRVAVIDDGVETHNDLNNLLPIGFTPLNSGGNGRPQGVCFRNIRVGHGQACAGIIGADNNLIGTRGVATNVDILPVNIFTGSEVFSDIALAIDWAWHPLGGNADILSNSWGSPRQGASSDAVIAAIQRARSLGRRGKGCVVVFSSGNSHQSFSGVTFPANVEGVITVGAIDINGNLHYYSSRGGEMDLVAPSGGGGVAVEYAGCYTGTSSYGIVTLDRMGASGYEVGNYAFEFNGTSAACPQVAGVAALMLQTNPNLTEVQVREILQQTARDLGTTGFDNDTGYGLVDAQAAVLRAQFCNISNLYVSGTGLICSGSEFYSIFSAPAGATIVWQVTGGLTIRSGQNTATVGVIGNSGGTIQAIITSCGASYTTPALSISVSSPPFMGVNYTYNNGSSMHLALTYAVGDETIINVNNICLGYTSGGYLVANITSGSVTFMAISGATISYRDNRSAWLNIAPGAVGTVQVTATNSCGTETQTMALKISNCGTPNPPGDPNPTNPCNNPPKLYNISPNPASEQIKISVATSITEKPIPVECPPPPKIKSMIDSKEGITFSEVNIYNSFGMLVLSTQTNKAKEFVIPLKTLKTGLYLVQISEGEHTERHQIVIE